MYKIIYLKDHFKLDRRDRKREEMLLNNLWSLICPIILLLTSKQLFLWQVNQNTFSVDVV